MLFELVAEISAIVIAVLIFAIIFIKKHRNIDNQFFICKKCGESFCWYMGYSGYCPYCGESFNTLIKNKGDESENGT